MHLRQIALVARSLEPTVSELRGALDLPEPFADPGVGEFGLVNAVLPVGDAFLEVVSPVRADATAARYLARRGGDGGYMVILQTDDLAADRKRLDGLGVRVVWSVTLRDVASVHLHPRDLPGAIVSLDEPVPAGSWRWGGPGWETKRRSARVEDIVGAEIQSADPGALAARWRQVLGLGPARREGEAHVLDLARGHALRFVPLEDGRGEGLSAVWLRAREGWRRAGDGAVRIGGVRFVLV
ncbi:MAG TPA: VOC family protein [Myxococcota bacterium]|jgi:hypothetical protein|nr:VOC family protein [Myxococcota bacterium]